ncbi:MAG: cupin [Omnitrophica bacterium RIFOXYB12_FULL_50_7]|nr:MAG: cupin [Omnitrophica bacterium RIFOXYB12_FULL_50_7]
MAQQTALKITVEKPTTEKLNTLKIFSWPIWTKEVSSFDWYYDEKEICYFLEGEVTVKTPDGEVSFGKGDLVMFPRGLKCVWNIKKPVKKHYQFG